MSLVDDPNSASGKRLVPLTENKVRYQNAAMAEENKRLREALADMTKRVENSWERRDLASDSDLEAVEGARRLLNR